MMVRTLLAIAILVCVAQAQIYPDAPSQRHCYTNADSKGTMIEIPCDQVPKVSNVRDWTPVVVVPSQPGFWTFRAKKGTVFADQPALRTNRDEWHSKLFLVANGALLAAAVTDVEYTHGKRESRGSEYPAMFAVIGIDYLMDRFFTRAFSVEGPIYGIQHYVRDAFRGR